MNKNLLPDIEFYKEQVKEYKLKQIQDGSKGNGLIEKVTVYIDELLGVIRSSLVENQVQEADIKMKMDVYRDAFFLVMDNNVPPPPKPVDNDEKDEGVIGKIKENVVPILAAGAGIVTILKGGYSLYKVLSKKSSPEQREENYDQIDKVVYQDQDQDMDMMGEMHPPIKAVDKMAES